MAEQEGITVKKSENFSEWYTQVVLKSGMADYAPTQGCIVFREYSYAIWEKIQEILNKMLKDSEHKNVYFPLFIPESLLKKEAEHFKGFVPECAWVTEGGNSKLEEKLALRPTSETIMYSMFSKWIRSWRDLPLKINQWCNIVRWESATKPFLRTREFLWQEGHTAHETKEEADEEVMTILNFYVNLIENYLAIPILSGTKTENEKFKGALYTTTLEALMSDGKILQAGTSHNLGRNFSKVFNIKFANKNKKENYVWQTSWGVSTRLLGALIITHGDDKGLVLPPKIAPYQVVIVPIYYKDKEKRGVLKKTKIISDDLKKNGISVIVDDREVYSPGWKFNDWEMKGVPLRIEIGPKDVQNKQVVVVRRDAPTKTEIKDKNVVKDVTNLLDDIQKNLFNKAKKYLYDHISAAKNYDELKSILKEKGGFVKVSWCGDSNCETKLKEESGITIRLIPFKKEKVSGKCFRCGRKAKEVVYVGKAY